jgi:ribose-phosphate pyrophosphokinase
MLLLNNQPVKFFKFNGGELQVNVGQCETERAVLTWKPTNSDDIMLLLLTVNALKHQGVPDIMVDCLYLPYARQDRVCAAGEAFSLQVMIKLLDEMQVSDIRFWDIHNSDLTLDMVENTCVHETEIQDIFAYYKFLDSFDLYNLILCAPDAGAREKVDKVVSEFQLADAIHFDKDRCPETGQIHGIKPNQYNRNYDGYNILVVDDICDGGRTFIEVAKKLKEHTSEYLYLYVTHGIFSNGLDELLQYYKHIYCHHVLDDEKYGKDNRLTILRSFNDISKPAM